MNGIAEMRKKAGMTQQALADALHIDRSTVAKWETGVAFPTGNKLPMVAKAMSCEISDLFHRPTEKKATTRKCVKQKGNKRKKNRSRICRSGEGNDEREGL